MEPGTRLGSYEILCPLGAGGMGEVYRARDTKLGREVAVKVLAEELATDAERLMRFEREARVLASLSHPNIATLFGFEEAGRQEKPSQHFLVMELVEGDELSARIGKGPISLAAALPIFRDIALGLEAAHEKGVVHRDLKPANIKITPDGRVKILDFGLAKVPALAVQVADGSQAPTQTAVTRRGQILGTLAYLSPEQARGLEVDTRTDIWAFGCCLFEALSGTRAFAGRDSPETLAKVLERDPPWDRLPAGTPERVRRLLRRCLAKDPEQRLHHIADARLLLDEARQRKGRGMWRWLGLGAAAALVVAIGLLPPSWQQSASARIDPRTAVAVLPFENLTGDEQLSHVGLGLAAGLISHLSRLPEVNTVSRWQAWDQLKRLGSTARLGEQLGVNTLIEGEVHIEGNGLRVDVRASDSISGRVLWSWSLPCERDKVYELQQRLLTDTARFLSVPLSPVQRRRLLQGGPPAQAFDYYLQGLERLERQDDPRSASLAAQLFRQAIRISDDVAVFHAALSSAIWRQWVQDHDGADLTEAEREAAVAVHLDPDMAEAHVALARALIGQGRPTQSMAELEDVLARHPKPDEAFRELAFGYELEGDIESQKDCLAQATVLGPENWFNWNDLGVFQAGQGDLEAATVSLQEAQRLAPPSVTWPRLNLGALKLLVPDFEGAIADFEATGSHTSDPYLASNMASAYFFLENYEQAEKLFRRAVELAPEDHGFHRNLGDVLIAIGRQEQGLEEYRTALRLVEAEREAKPRSAEPLRYSALYAAKAGDCPKALASVQAARPSLPRTWQNHLDLAMVFALCDRADKALEEVSICLEEGLPAGFLQEQPELQAIVDDPAFAQLVESSSESAPD